MTTASRRLSGGDLRHEILTLGRVVRSIAPGRTAAQTLATLLLGFTEGVSLLLLVPVVSALGPSGSVDAQELPVLGTLGFGSVSLEAALGVLVVVVILRACIARWADVNGTALRLTVVDRLRRDCLDAILRARWEFVLGRRRTDVVETITVSANRVGVAVDQTVNLTVGIVVTVATAVVALLISATISAVAILVSVVVALITLPVVRSARILGREFSARSKRAMAVTTDAMDALRLVRAHDAVEPWEMSLEASFADLRAAQLRHQRASANVNLVTSTLLVAGTALFVLVGVRADMSAATLVVLIIVLSRLARRFLGITNTLQNLAMSLVALVDIEGLRQDAVDHQEAPHAPATRVLTPPEPGAVLVELAAVTYRYPDGTLALSGVDLEIPAGAVTVLVGPSGAGKSTVVDVILGLLVPESGVVTVSGRPLASDLLTRWRAGIGYVPQDTALLPGTLRDNLVWSAGAGDISDDACWAALDDAAAAFARRLPDGLDTLVGDRGVRLSGGERQRVALARALVRDPVLLILDEATSALDYETEASVLGTVRGLCPRTTVLLVTHRISAIAPSDHVVEISAPSA